MLLHRWFRRLCRRVRRRVRGGRRLPPARSLAGFAVAAATLTLAPPSSVAQTGPPVVHRPPVAAPVVDGFRPPSHPYGPGNRGLEYDTDPGTEVRASAAGQVVFAGEVAGSLHVTLLHADGVRTSYSFLERIEVVVGQSVRQGDRIARAGERLHFGARQGDSYFDPTSLFDRATRVEVELLPFEVPPGASPDQESAALVWFGADGGGGIALPDLGDVARWAVERAQVLRHYGRALDPSRRGARLMWDIADRLASPPPCTDEPPPRRPAAASDRVAVLVAGLGSSSRSAAIDDLRATELGYDPDDLLRFSYAGGRTPASDPAFSSIGSTTYESTDTQGDLQASALRLVDLVEATLAERPEATVDIYAHSMGGVVTRLAVQELVRRGVDPERLGLVATFGSPHRGADLATAVSAANATLMGDVGLDGVEALLDTGFDPDAPAIAQLAETSEMIEALDESALPEGVEMLSLAARGDLVVAAPNSTVAGARNITVGLAGGRAHSDLVGSDEATQEVARALAGQPQGCEGAWDVISDQVMGHGISYAEDLAGFAAVQPGG